MPGGSPELVKGNPGWVPSQTRLSALKRGCKHQRQRQAQMKTGEAYNFRTCRIHDYLPTLPFFILYFLLSKPSIHSFKSIENLLQNERDHAHLNLENLSFFFFLSHLFFSFIFFSSPSPFLFFFLPYFLSELTPFCAPLVLGTPSISLELP